MGYWTWRGKRGCFDWILVEISCLPEYYGNFTWSRDILEVVGLQHHGWNGCDWWRGKGSSGLEGLEECGGTHPWVGPSNRIASKPSILTSISKFAAGCPCEDELIWLVKYPTLIVSASG